MGGLMGVGLAGAVIFLDTTAVAQLMICQPLIACPIWGWILGRPEVGLFFGVGFQLLWLASLPVGAAKFPEGNLGALVATDLAARVPATASGDPAWLVLTLSTIGGLIVAQLGRELTPVVRRVMDRYAPQLISAAEAGRIWQFRWLFAGAVGIHAASGMLFTMVAVLLGRLAMAAALGEGFRFGLNESVVRSTDPPLWGLWPALIGAGTGVMAARFVRKKTRWLFGLGVALFLPAGLL